jgi:hypothetical protein
MATTRQYSDWLQCRASICTTYSVRLILRRHAETPASLFGRKLLSFLEKSCYILVRCRSFESARSHALSMRRGQLLKPVKLSQQRVWPWTVNSLLNITTELLSACENAIKHHYFPFPSFERPAKALAKDSGVFRRFFRDTYSINCLSFMTQTPGGFGCSCRRIPKLFQLGSILSWIPYQLFPLPGLSCNLWTLGASS